MKTENDGGNRFQGGSGFFNLKEWSFASHMNDMLLLNVIYSLNANMTGSTASNMICLASPNVVVSVLRWLNKKVLRML